MMTGKSGVKKPSLNLGWKTKGKEEDFFLILEMFSTVFFQA